MTPPPSISKSQDSNDNLSISSITRKIAHLSNNNSQEDDNCDGDDYAPSETLLAVNISEAICRGNLHDLELILKGLQLTPNNFDSSYGNLLHIAASLAPLDTFKRILQWTELSPNSRSSQDGSTALHIVTKLDRMEIVEFLLSLPEIDDGITDNQGKTCIDYCTSKRCKQLFQIAQRTFRENTCKTLFKAAQKGQIDIIQSITTQARSISLVDFNASNAQGESILHIASRKGNEELVKFCLTLGIDPFMKNRRGKIPFEVAKRPEIKQLLKQAPMIRSKKKEIPCFSDDDDSVIIIQGFLYKYTNFAGGYRRRWFVLERGVISYYNDSSEYPVSCRGSLNLDYVQLIPNSTSAFKFDIVSLHNPAVKFHLKAESREEAKRWIISIEQAILALKSTIDSSHEHNTNLMLSLMNTKSQSTSSEISENSANLSGSFVLLRQEAQIHQLFESLMGHFEGIEKNTTKQQQKPPISLIQLKEIQNALLGNCGNLKAILERFDVLLAQKNRRLDAQRKEKDLLEDAVRSLASENNKWQVWARKQLSRLDSGTSSRASVIEQPTTMTTVPTTVATTTKNSDLLSSLENHMIESKLELLQEDSDNDVDDDLSTSEEEFYDVNDEFYDISDHENGEDKVYDHELVMDTIHDEHGYPVVGREVIPVDSTLMPAISLWNILKNVIRQQDLSRMPIPINFSEPLSMLQRMCEDLEYVDLLESVVDSSDPARRLLNVAVFAITSYSGTDKRTSKPFNPLLGETYELITPKFKYLAEQVSHHPPIGASYCEAPGFSYWNEVHVTSRFKGKYLELRPEGLSHVQFQNPSVHYSWNRVSTAVNNIIVGKLYLEHYGKMRVQSHGLDGLEAEINFMSNGWRRDTCNRIQGKVYNRATGQVHYKLSGTWNGSIMATRMNSNGEDAESFLVWKRSETPPGSEIMYNFSSFAMKLNELTGPLKEALCGTDSRLRPDQRAMEEGEFELAGKLKVKLEEKQRRARKLTEHQERKPRWFHQCTEKDTNQNHWQFTGNYWQDRKLKNWTEIPDIFL